MRTPKQPVARWMVLGALVAAVSCFSVAAWGQATKPVAPPPADLEPGVNTSATQPSSSEAPPTPAPTPAPATKVAPTPARTGRTTAPQPTATPAAGATGPAPSAASTGSAPAPKTASTTTPKSGAPGKAHDKIELDTTQITGNRELPKVLYIVPWKRSDLGDLVGKPVNSLLDEVLAPVDRDVFKRQNRYYDALKPDEAKEGAGAAAGVTEKR